MVSILDEPAEDSAFLIEGTATRHEAGYLEWRVLSKTDRTLICAFYGPVSRLAAICLVNELDTQRQKRERERLLEIEAEAEWPLRTLEDFADDKNYVEIDEEHRT